MTALCRSRAEVRRKGRAHAAVFAVALICWSCSPQASDDTEHVETRVSNDTSAPEQSYEPVTAIECEGLEYSMLPTELTRAAVKSRFGAPDSMSSSAEPNRHVPGAIDSLHVLHYPDLRIGFRTPGGAGDMVTDVTLTDNRYVVESAIGIGATAGEVRRILGEPRRQSSAALVYDCGEGAEQPVTFHLANGIVRMISIEYYVD